MNFAILRWLLQHRDVITKCVDILKEWDADAPLMDRWAIIDAVARVVIPVISKEDMVAMQYPEFEDDMSALSLGAEIQQLGFDWALLVRTLVPIIMAILQSLVPSDE
jgi:hypothetical protein